MVSGNGWPSTTRSGVQDRVPLNSNPKSEFNHLILAMPALCGTQSENRIREQLSLVSQTDFQKWKNSEIGKTGKMKRREAFSQKASRSSEQKLDQLKSG